MLCRATYHGFESHPLRHFNNIRAAKARLLLFLGNGFTGICSYKHISNWIQGVIRVKIRDVLFLKGELTMRKRVTTVLITFILMLTLIPVAPIASNGL